MARRSGLGPTVLDTPCRVYRGPLQGEYGRRSRGTPPNRTRQALHRWVWEQINGPISEGMVVMHRCDNPPCFRYDHLKLGTQVENIADMHEKQRASGGRWRAQVTHCPQGHEYTPDNTYHREDKRGRPYRQCKRCTSGSTETRRRRRQERSSL